MQIVTQQFHGERNFRVLEAPTLLNGHDRRSTGRQLWPIDAYQLSELESYVHDPDSALSMKTVQNVTICVLALSRHFAQCRITSCGKVALTAKRLWLPVYATSTTFRDPDLTSTVAIRKSLLCKSSSDAFIRYMECETTLTNTKPFQHVTLQLILSPDH
jgi:hypothetical protein